MPYTKYADGTVLIEVILLILAIGQLHNQVCLTTVLCKRWIHVKNMGKKCNENQMIRNESNIFSIDRGIKEKRTGNCINAHVAHCCESFPFFFRLIPRSTKKMISFYFLSFDFHCISTKKKTIKLFYRRIISNF